jgi:hypothetical protein
MLGGFLPELSVDEGAAAETVDAAAGNEAVAEAAEVSDVLESVAPESPESAESPESPESPSSEAVILTVLLSIKSSSKEAG